MIRTTIAIVAGALMLAGCGSGGSPDSEPYTPDPDEVAVSDIRWPDDGGNQPELSFPLPLRLTEPTAAFMTAGEGEEIAVGDLVVFETTVFNGEDGSVLESTFQTGEPETLILSVDTTEATMLAAFTQAKVGARFVYGRPAPDVVAPDATPSAAATPADQADGASPDPTSTDLVPQPSVLLAITVRSTTQLPDAASGAPVDPPAGLPAIDFDEEGNPTMAPQEGEPPADLVAQPLIEGTGPVVDATQVVAVKYAGWLWDGTLFDSTWGATVPAAFSLSGVIQGWGEGLAGQKVGSRVLLVVPPALGYGGAGTDTVPPSSTLVFLVDILGAY
ncbi:MAG: FKBP-type peptidyl-prolyl cis-trans isomerase [Bifidobacteriaceae bacterium]|jgi:peptidylprolyl isomerase|nr:FKBP-type peptidyl-prolyl cis-trans isomerase [Bifidobacteriaceae bacterium]